MNTLSVLNTVSARQLQRDYKSVFAKVNKTNSPIMVISNNKPQVVILSIKELDSINKFYSEQKFWEAVREIQTKNSYNDPISTQKDIDEAVEEARQKVYDKYYRSPGQQRPSKRPTLSTKRTRKDSQTLESKEISSSFV
jgi:prevent-host-death family protein